MPELYVQPPRFGSVAEERLHVRQRLAAAFRLFARFGYDQGAAGHVTARDPERRDHFWVNPIGMDFGDVRTSDLVLVSHDGEVVEGKYAVNPAALAIHSHVHQARPDANAAAHSHSLHGKVWSSLGRLLDPITQDACAFYEDHALYDDFRGVVLDAEEGRGIGEALGGGKALILRNHGLLTVGQTVDSAVWWFIAMERACDAQIRAESVGRPVPIPHEQAVLTCKQTGSEAVGWFNFQPLYQRIVREQPDLLE